MDSITLGSVEELVVEVQDQLHQLTALPGGTTFEVTNSQDAVIFSGVATVSGMRATCLIDTTGVQWVTGRYSLRLRFATGLEIPVLTVGEFQVNP